MHKINGATAVDGHFIDGSVTQQGTIVTADWLNTVQDEICNAIVASGIPLNPIESDDRKQLINSINKLIANAIINLASKSDLNGFIKDSNLKDNEYIKWCITWVEYMSSVKYPNLPKPK